MPSKAPSQKSIRRKRLLRRIAFSLLGASPLMVLGLWIAVNRVEWLGPIVADGLRAVIGKDAVTELENIGYGVQDRFYQYSRRGETPKAYWEVPPPEPSVSEPQADVPAPVEDAKPVAEALPPADVGPVHESWSAPGDGLWAPVRVPDLPQLAPRMWKTLLHPDKNRSWAEVFVVALRIDSVDIHLVAGTREPVATVPGLEGLARPGRIPEAAELEVLAAFNGGFKTEHGGYGMRIGDTTFIEPIATSCAVAMFDDHHVEVAPWNKLAERESQMLWWRQTPNCMVEDGELHERLKSGHSTKWGATLDGETVIRRSAIGVTPDGRYVLVGISNHTTAVAIAEAMRHAGAQTVAQLDVNFSYPKFVLFERKAPEGKRLAVALADGFEFSEDEYIRSRSIRDFFYVTPRLQKEAAGHGRAPVAP